MVYVLWGLWVMLWWGVLFCCLCTTTFLCIPYGPYTAYSFIFFYFFLFCVLISLFICPYVFSFFPFVWFFHAWMKTLGGCGCICIICSHICILKWVYLTYFPIVVTIGQDSMVRHVVFDNVCVLACHFISILFVCVHGTHSLPLCIFSSFMCITLDT